MTHPRPPRRFALVMLAILGTLAGPSLADEAPVDCAERMAAHPGAWRALPPGTPDRLKRAMAQGDPSLHLWKATLVCDEIDATICTEAEGAGTCAHLDLTDPDRGCTGVSAGPFCVLFTEAQAPSQLQAPILARLGTLEDLWRPVERAPVVVDAAATGAEAKTPAAAQRVDASLWPLAVSVLALLFLVGLGVRIGAIDALPLGVRAAMPLVLALGSAVFSPTWSTWDLLTAGGLLSLTAWATARWGRPDRRTWLRLMGAGVATLLLAEGAVRLTLPAPPQTPPPQHARLLFAPESRETACQALFPEQYPDALRRGERAVLHLGDSMVYGAEVEPEERFTSLLAAADQGVVHLNAGFPGTGPDHHLRVLQRWLPELKPSAVVLYLYPGNDLVDLDRAYACCDHGPLLDEALVSRCDTPDWSFPLQALLARSPAPYPIRAAASHLALAAHLHHAFSRVTEWLEPRLGEAAGTPEVAAAWVRYGQVLAAIKALTEQRGVELTAVLLPTRAALEPGARPGHAAGVGDQMAEVATQQKLRLLDARPLFEGLSRDGSYAHLFGDRVTWDEHLGLEGHRVLSDWLQTRL